MRRLAPVISACLTRGLPDLSRLEAFREWWLERFSLDELRA